MPQFTLSNTLLERIAVINQFNLPAAELSFAGLRGCIPVNYQDQSFKNTLVLNTIDINYRNPRCTLMQWTDDGKISAFPGSTVPHINNIITARNKNGLGANCLMTGFYTDYRKGWHKAGAPSGHEAFRQNAPRPVRRSTDDLDYENDDRVEYDNPQDNFHCGWFGSISAELFASAGCQVVMGYPKCKKPNRTENTGPWKIFHDNAYSISQDSFPYMLLNGLEVLNIANHVNKKMVARLRYGSSGQLVKDLQVALKNKNFYEGILDGNFQERTFKAVLAFQKSVFGIDDADGIVGPMTAQTLNITLPAI
jgi:hypothetical protein